MLADKTELIKSLILTKTGADVLVAEDKSHLSRAGLRVYFDGYTKNQGPVFKIRPRGLKRHLVSLSFGSYAAECIQHIQQNANDEQWAVARGLIEKLNSQYALDFSGKHSLDAWKVDKDLQIQHELKTSEGLHDDVSISNTVKQVMLPLIAAMAELIGYDEYGEDFNEEGARALVTTTKRERSPRNRMLCLQLHGHFCGVCNLDPKKVYGDEHGSILEVHHIEQLSEIDAPRVYDPRTDLIPLCPNCHRSIHSQAPALTPGELRAIHQPNQLFLK
ncbi:HNH endonuclease [Verrucomicrobia bacterium]|nr:HNH endonuclease [Verrucomicrobiota bacterium]